MNITQFNNNAGHVYNTGAEGNGVPRYESENDRIIQQRITNLCCAAWNASAFPTPADLMHCYDVAFVKFNPVTMELTGTAIGEIKSRRDWLYGRSTFVASKVKWNALKDAAQARGCPALFIVHDRPTGIVRYCVVQDDIVYDEIPNWGRGDRPEDPGAIETGVVILTRAFRTIGTLTEEKTWKPN